MSERKATVVLHETEIQSFIQEYPEWQYIDNALHAHYEFSDFEDAMNIVGELVVKIEELDHHPFWSNEYNKLSFILCTHECDNKVSQLDIDLATNISDLVKSKMG
jgi:4a-hydroxytetrahydrobiopterin dehydratase